MSNTPRSKGPGSGTRNRDSYKKSGVKRETPEVQCQHCKEIFPLKSNIGIQEEVSRLGAYLEPKDPISCPNTSCENHGHDVYQEKSRYHKHSPSPSGSSRFRCKACKKTFSVGKPSRGQKKPHKNREIFSLLINKMPIRRIVEHTGVSASTVYGKINFFHSQCMAFVAHRERKLLNGFPVDRLDVSVDRQEYVVNWNNQWDKRNVRLQAVGSADNRTGYVFGMHVNFDPSLNPLAVEADAAVCGDNIEQKPFRKYARLWLVKDYATSAHRSASRSGKPGNTGMLNVDIMNAYADAETREDVEAAEELDVTTRLPVSGMQIHSEYTLYGHFYLLKKLFGGVGKVRFFLDQESGIRAACLAAFSDEILERRCDAFYVRINKDMTVNEKRRMVRKSLKAFEEYQVRYPGIKPYDILLMITVKLLNDLEPLGKWNDRWLSHPFPKMSEPEKAAALLTDFNDYEKDHLAHLYIRASLHGIDRFFMQVRRMLSMAERPIGSASNRRRTWYGYSPYNPVWMIKLLDIYRVYYNYCKTGKDDETPAQSIGLAKGVIRIEDILYFE